MAIYIKPVKCRCEKRLHIPQKESKSKVHPCRRKLEKHIKMHIIIFTINIDRKGG